MPGVPECWNCHYVDTWSSSRRMYCESCDANLWLHIFPGHEKQPFRPGSRNDGYFKSKKIQIGSKK